jgi:HSP20 family protein
VPNTTPDTLEKFLAFQREVNRLFRRMFEEGSGSTSALGESLATPANVMEIGGELHVEVETAGCPWENLSLWVSRDLIVVEGDKPADSGPRDDKVTYHCMERDFGPFRRVLEIPCPVDANAIRATYRSGLLTVILPRIEDRRGERRRVPITPLPSEREARSKCRRRSRQKLQEG